MLEAIHEQYASLGEIKLISALRHEVANFRPNFKVNVQNTLLLTPYASNIFGLGFYGEVPAFGIPDLNTGIGIYDQKNNCDREGTLWDLFIRVRWYGVFAKPGSKAVYWLFDFGENGNSRRMALRLEMRQQRVEALLQHRQVMFARMSDHDGESEPEDDGQSFLLDVHPIDKLFWENND